MIPLQRLHLMPFLLYIFGLLLLIVHNTKLVAGTRLFRYLTTDRFSLPQYPGDDKLH